jgi:rod shape-determining protein MreD
MFRSVRIILVTVLALLLQVAVFPAYLRDPFKPNLLLLLICYLALRQHPLWLGGIAAYLLGLVQDCFSGIYFGLNGYSFLLFYLMLRHLAAQLYTNNGHLMVLVVFLATIISGVFQLLLLLLFSTAPGIYASLLPALVPHALVNALAASIVFGVLPFKSLEEWR